MATTRQRIQLRRDTAANWTAANPILLAGEIGVELDTKRMKLGDGVASWNALAYFDPQSVNGLPEGGDSGNVLLKTSQANYDADWLPSLDGGTFN
jgi:hypothetical protein